MLPRVRFAPSPTGLMHIGGVRTALLNYIFARQKNGTFILRIEDTDSTRNFDPGAQKIMSDLQWLHLKHDEGPIVQGPYAPYYQSERASIYQAQLEILKKRNNVYKCFCSNEILEHKRQQAIALKMPPRYDRLCLKLTAQEIADKSNNNIPFIWRFKIPEQTTISITDMAYGIMDFELKNFADFPLTRADGSCTFLFTNAVDDMAMAITHVLRGSDHLSNTANQALLYQAFEQSLPLFWHLPIICNTDGKKLSKRDFGFALEHLQQAGFLPEAVINYVAIIGSSYAEEIMSLDKLIEVFNFEKIPAAGNIRYDVDKLRWVNHKWIQNYSPKKLLDCTLPFIQASYSTLTSLPLDKQLKLMELAKPHMVTLPDAVLALNFYFNEPDLSASAIHEQVSPTDKNIFEAILSESDTHTDLDNPALFIKTLQEKAKGQGLSSKVIFTCLRLALTGTLKGPTLLETIEILGKEVTLQRLQTFNTIK